MAYYFDLQYPITFVLTIQWLDCDCRNVNDGFKINTQTQLAPVLASVIKVDPLKKFLSDGFVER